MIKRLVVAAGMVAAAATSGAGATGHVEAAAAACDGQLGREKQRCILEQLRVQSDRESASTGGIVLPQPSVGPSESGIGSPGVYGTGNPSIARCNQMTGEERQRCLMAQHGRAGAGSPGSMGAGSVPGTSP
jgi:hypothetical protein